jgi:hypothetical protein
MSLIVSEPKGKSDYILVPEGNHLARCYRIVDIGTQKTVWKGEEKAQKKVMLFWELHGEDSSGKPLVTSDGRPLVTSKKFTPSLNEKATLRKFLSGWRGKQFTHEELEGFSLPDVLDKWCMMTITHTKDQNDPTKVYANIESLSSVPSVIRKAGLPEGINPVGSFDIDEPDMEIFAQLTDYMKGVITSSPEWRMRNSNENYNQDDASYTKEPSDIPF